MSANTAMTDQRDQLGVDADHPWPGLKPFTEDLQDYFHGRRQEADDLFRRVRRKQLTILFGQSGLGKTSLLQAGLFPKLRGEGFLPVVIRFSYDSKAASLSCQIKAAIRQTLQDAATAPAALPDPEQSLWEYFHGADNLLRGRDGKPLSLVLVFDQFEEFFTLGRTAAPAIGSAGFVEELADLVENRPPESVARRLEDDPDVVHRFAFDRRDFRVLLSLREEYLADLEGLRRRLPSLGENRMRLVRMNGGHALEAILKPAGNLLSAEVAERIVRFIASEEKEVVAGNGHTDARELNTLEIEPWLLSLVCYELNDRRLQKGLPQITAELVAGNTKDILAKFYQTCLERRAPVCRGAVREFIEERLLSKSGYRESMALDTAWEELQQRGAPSSAIDELVKERLLHVEQRLGAPRVELTHDKLAEAIKQSRDERRRLEAEARALEAAQEQVRQAEDSARRAREKLRRTRTRLAVTVGCLVALVGLLLATLWEWNIATQKEAEAVEAKADADTKNEQLNGANTKLKEMIEELEKAKKSAEQERARVADTYYRFAIPQAHREWLNGNTHKWEELLNGCLPDQRGWDWHYLKSAGPRELFSFRESSKSLYAVAFSKNGRWMAAAGWDGSIFLRLAATGEEVTFPHGKRMTHLTDINALAFSPDSRRLASAGLDKLVKIWDPERGEEISRFKVSGPVYNVVFAHDGTKIASLSGRGDRDSRGELTLWDVKTKQIVWQKQIGAVHFMSGLSFDPKGRFVASAFPGPVAPGEDALILSAQAGQEVYRFDGFPGKIYGISFSPDGRKLAAAGQQAAIKVWDLDIASKSKHLSQADLSKVALLHTLRGHRNLVSCVTFSSNNRHLASASWDQTVKLWDIQTGVEEGAFRGRKQSEEEVATFRGHTDHVNGVSFSANGSYLASVGNDGCRIWDLSRFPDYRILENVAKTYGVVFEPQGKRLYAGGYQGVQALDVQTGRLLFQLPHGHVVGHVALTSDGKLLAAGEGSYPGSPSTKTTYDVLLWDLGTRSPLPVLKGHTGQILGVAFHPTKKAELASVSVDGSVKIWDVRACRLLRSLPHKQPIWAVAYSPSGDYLAAAGKDGTIFLWDGQLNLKGELSTPDLQKAEALAFSSDGKRLLSSGGENLVAWDLEKREPVITVNVKANITGIAFHKRVLALSTLDRSLLVLDAETGKELLPPLRGYTSPVEGVAFSPDGRHLVSTGSQIIVWDALPSGEIFTLRDSVLTINTLAISPDEKRLVSGGDDKIVRIWDCQTGKLLSRLPQPKRVFAMAFSPDSKRMAFDQDAVVKVCDVAGREVGTFPGPPPGFSQAGTVGWLLGQLGAGPLPAAATLFPGQTVQFLAFSPDGETLAIARSDYTVALVESATWKEQKTLRGHTETIFSLSFSRDGKRLASGSKDKTIIIWDVASGKKLSMLRGHEDSIQEVSFNGDGRYLASASKDKTVRIWDTQSGKAKILEGHLVPVWSVAFHPRENTVVSTDEMGLIKVWDPVRNQELATLRGHTGSVSYVSFGAKGTIFATAGREGTVRIWELGQPNESDSHTPEGHRWLAWYFNKASMADKGHWPEAVFLNRLRERSATSSGPGLARLLVGRGIALANLGDYTEAIAHFDKGLSIDPKYADAYNRRGKIWFRMKQYDKAVKDFSEAIRLNPQKVVYYQDRGDAYTQLRDYEKALADDDKAVQLDPKDPVNYVLRGIDFRDLKKYQKAIADFSEAIRLKTDYTFAYNERGRAWQILKDYDQAIGDFNKALELNPKDKFVLIYRGDAWRDQGKFSQAFADYDAALRIDPTYAEAFNRRGNAWYIQRKYDKATEDYTKALNLNPKDKVLWTNRGDAWRDLGKYSQAFADYDAALRIDPKYAEAFYRRGITWHRQREYKKAITEFTEAIRLKPEAVLFYRNRGYSYTQLREYEKSLADDDKAVHLDPNDPVNFFNRGLDYRDLKKYKQALADFNQVIKLDPDYSLAYEQRGLIWYSQHQYDKAIADYSKALAISPKDKFILTNRGDAWRDQRKYAQALADYDQALGIDPKYAGAYNSRGILWNRQKQYKKAIADYSEAIRLSTAAKNPVYFANRGLSYSEWKQFQQALDDFSEAIRLDPGYAFAYRERGLTWYFQKEYDKAIEDLDEAVRLHPKVASYYRDRAAIHTDMQEHKKALADDDRAAAKLPRPTMFDRYQSALLRLANKDSVGYRSRCAAMLLGLGKHSDPDALFWAARAAVLSPAPTDSPPLLPWAEPVLGGDPDNGDYLTVLGAVLYRAGKFEQAVKRLTQAEAAVKRMSNPRTTPAYCWNFLAMAHQRLGNHEEAQRWLAQAMSEAGKDAGLSWNRKLTLQLLAKEAQELVER